LIGVVLTGQRKDGQVFGSYQCLLYSSAQEFDRMRRFLERSLTALRTNIASMRRS
jgi:hypothetical protein